MNDKVKVGDVIRVLVDKANGAECVRKDDLYSALRVDGDWVVIRVDGKTFPYSIHKENFEVYPRAVSEDSNNGAPDGETLQEMAGRFLKEEGNKTVQEMLFFRFISDGRADAMTAKLRDWAKRNPPKPVKTYKDDFFEKFPDAWKTEAGFPKAHLSSLYQVSDNKRLEFSCLSLLRDVWDKPLGYWEGK